MKRNEWKKWVGVAGRMLLAYALVFAQGAWAAQNQAAKDKPASPQKAAAQQANEKQSAVRTNAKAQTEQAQGEEPEGAVGEEKSSGDGRHEGIKVHGHWTIEVRNSDGTIVTHREFENSLLGGAIGGAHVLAYYLARGLTVGQWQVQLQGNVCSNGGPYDCFILEQAPGTPAGHCDSFNCNTLAPSTSGAGASTIFVLSGTMVAALTGTITGVRTTSFYCPPTTPAASCNALVSNASYDFTGTTLSAPVQVSAGQTIAVTVNISFS